MITGKNTSLRAKRYASLKPRKIQGLIIRCWGGGGGIQPQGFFFSLFLNSPTQPKHPSSLQNQTFAIQACQSITKMGGQNVFSMAPSYNSHRADTTGSKTATAVEPRQPLYVSGAAASRVECLSSGKLHDLSLYQMCSRGIEPWTVEPKYPWRDQTSPDIFPNRAKTCKTTR